MFLPATILFELLAKAIVPKAYRTRVSEGIPSDEFRRLKAKSLEILGIGTTHDRDNVCKLVGQRWLGVM
jgi:hypothetical protein